MKLKGFTLIELMIVVGIISLLAVVIIPAYQDYVIRAQITQGLSLATGAQFAIEETTAIKNALPDSQAETGYISPTASRALTSITIANDGTALVTVLFPRTAGGGTILIRPSLDATGTLAWDCTGGTLAVRYRPSICRP